MSQSRFSFSFAIFQYKKGIFMVFCIVKMKCTSAPNINYGQLRLQNVRICIFKKPLSIKFCLKTNKYSRVSSLFIWSTT